MKRKHDNSLNEESGVKMQKNRKSCLQVFNILPWIYYWRIKDRLSLDVLDVSIYLYKGQQIWEQSVRNLGL
jgi:hypothetical protein